RRSCRQPEKEVGKSISNAAGRVGEQTARVAAVVGEAVLRRVAHNVKAALDRVRAGDPGGRGAERVELLIKRPEAVPPARSESGIAVAKAHAHVPKGRTRVLANHGVIGSNVALIKANALKKRGRRSVAVPKQELKVEAAPGLVDDIRFDDSRIGERQR